MTRTAISAATAASALPGRGFLRRALLYAGALMILLWSASPFVWQFATSFQLDKALTSGTPTLIPDPFTWEHYYNVFVEKQLHLYVLNSLIVSLATTFLCLAIGSLAAFALSRLDIRGRYGILMVILSVSMFPQITLVGPLYIVASALQLLDTYTALILVYIALVLPLVTWVMYGYFETLPREIDEAARMDGLHAIGIYWFIILPMSLPSLVTTGLLAFITAWNEFLFALAFTSNIDHQTIPVGIANFTNLYFVPWGDIAAASAIVTAPLILLVLVFQRHIIEGLTQGGIKE
ncbi:carbohydrate ABC transporter permease [Alloyangia pacifica]|uniref:Multiple sugar transport system permease protein n=1 Tax=Alloyangia pacifica TaxID=311180 RepID=A0A1I6UK53_9RHOB|nr:carbohydrate ABC transporter permease [Alloyangia pacifica]SDH72503.1 multiple sugar transport system permease protein [Alloyangia pacifica]SFT01734.1 multiple sugar transport system permease protein [Alloyangia pacifica]